MSAEEIIPKLEKDIKDKLIEDCSKGLVQFQKVKKVFEKEGVKLVSIFIFHRFIKW